MSQGELAEHLGITFQQVQKYEKGANRISCSRLCEMAEALDCPITYFFPDETASQPDTTFTEALDPDHVKEGHRLLAAFAKIAKTKRKRVVALVESMVAIHK